MIITILFTDEQMEQLRPLFALAIDAAVKGKRGMILGQPNNISKEVKFGFIKEKDALALIETMRKRKKLP